MDDKINQGETDDQTPLEFYTAYLPSGDTKNYISNGKGGVRLFKDRSLLETWLKEKMSPDEFVRVVIHPVVANFVVPEPEPHPASKTTIQITTLYPPTVPTAGELLRELKTRKRHKPRGLR